MVQLILNLLEPIKPMAANSSQQRLRDLLETSMDPRQFKNRLAIAFF
jgi:hypothetical protein